MARIRTVKPEFWTSEQVVECSPMARLLFVGMWNFCDDAGIHPASVKRLKMEVFPGDDITLEQIDAYIDELKTEGLIQEYKIENKHFWLVTGWHHQKIDRPTFKYPSPTVRGQLDEPSSNGSGELDEPSPPEGKGRESKGKEEERKRTPLENALLKNKDFITKKFPHADFEVESLKMLSYFAGRQLGADPTPKVIAWFERVPKPAKTADYSMDSEETASILRVLEENGL